MYKITKNDILSHLITNVTDNQDTNITINESNITILGDNNQEFDFIDSIGVFKIQIQINDNIGNITLEELDLYVTFSPDITPPQITYTLGKVTIISNEYYSYPYIDEFGGTIHKQDLITWMGISVTDNRTIVPIIEYTLTDNNNQIDIITQIGNYKLQITAQDEAFRISTLLINVEVAVSPDTTPPVININSNNVTWNGALARWETTIILDNWSQQTINENELLNWLLIGPSVDSRDGIVSTTIEIKDPFGTIIHDITQISGNNARYLIKLSASDSSSNIDEIEIWANAIVLIDNTPPEIIFKPVIVGNMWSIDFGNYTTQITKSQLINDSVLECFDVVDGNIDITTINLIIKDLSNNFIIQEIDTIGNYLLTYSCSDASNNTVTANIIAEVILSPDTVPPIIHYTSQVNTSIMRAQISVTTYPFVSISTNDIINQLILSITDNRDSGPFGVICRIYDLSDTLHSTIDSIGEWKIEFEVSDSSSNQRIDSIQLFVEFANDINEPLIWWNLTNVQSNSINYSTKTAQCTLYLSNYLGSIINEGICQNELIDLIEDNYDGAIDKNNAQVIFIQNSEQLPFITETGTYLIKITVQDNAHNIVIWTLTLNALL